MNELRYFDKYWFRLCTKSIKGGWCKIISLITDNNCSYNDGTERDLIGEELLADMIFDAMREDYKYIPKHIMTEFERNDRAKSSTKTACKWNFLNSNLFVVVIMGGWYWILFVLIKF